MTDCKTHISILFVFDSHILGTSSRSIDIEGQTPFTRTVMLAHHTPSSHYSQFACSSQKRESDLCGDFGMWESIDEYFRDRRILETLLL